MNICNEFNPETHETCHLLKQHTGPHESIADTWPSPRANLADTLSAMGSFRRVMESYWNGNLSPVIEKEIEERFANEKHILIGYKPIA